jgi:hypothetical protein
MKSAPKTATTDSNKEQISFANISWVSCLVSKDVIEVLEQNEAAAIP